ncbi:MAG TPA: DUF2330 domain-containing protein [Acidimicrobiales bacterium]
MFLRRCGLSFVSLSLAILASIVAAAPALACGGLVGENGTIRLVKTTTLAAFHDGVERYVTSFQFTGSGESVGSIVPLPGVPTDVKRGGDWTLQRLVQEVTPVRTGSEEDAFATAGASVASARVLQEAKIDALDITILEGGGDEVGRWAVENGFFLTPDAPEVLDFYAHRSQIFMAAKFDASRAAALGQRAGDGTPIMLTIPTNEPWVPLRILALGLDESQFVEADVFLLTDDEPRLLTGGPGVTVSRSTAATRSLLDDLRSDKGMEWVPGDMWLSHLQVATPAGDLDYDLAISTKPGVVPAAVDTGVLASEAVAIGDGSRGFGWLWPVAGVAAGLAVIVGWHALSSSRRRAGAVAA